MNTVIVKIPTAEPSPGCNCPKTFSVKLDGVERDALYSVRQGLIESGGLVNRRDPNTVSGAELVRWLCRRIGGVDEEAPSPKAKPAKTEAKVKPRPTTGGLTPRRKVARAKG